MGQLQVIKSVDLQMLHNIERPKTVMSFKERMEDRLKRWYKSDSADIKDSRIQRRRYIAGLVSKTNMFTYAQKHNIPLPQRYAEAKSVNDINFELIPERVVVKPSNSADSDCVMLFNDGKEIFTGTQVTPKDRPKFIEDAFKSGRFLNSYTKILFEEFIQDYDTNFTIPRDFKIYVAGGRAHLIQVIDRNGPKNTWNHSFYDPSWTEIQDEMQKTYARGPQLLPPPHLKELIFLSEKIAEDIGCFMRLDFFISAERVIFGEFTSYPFGGKDYTPTGDKFMCELMDRFPDPF